MKNLILFCTILFCSNLFAQQSTFVAGKNLLDSTDIQGVEYKFSDKIFNFFVDTTSNFLTVQLRGVSKNEKYWNNKGNFLQYDLNIDSILWKQKINYQTEKILQSNKTLILSTLQKNIFIDTQKGKEKFSTKNNIMLIFSNKNIAIGYRSKMQENNNLEGMNLSTGKVLWTTKISRDYGWNDVLFLNDTTLLIVANGLNAVNLNNGKGWKYEVATGDKDYTAAALTTLGGIVLGLFTGTFVYGTGYDLVYDVVSNVAADSTYIYFASKDNIAKINKNSGKIIWYNEFNKKDASKSFILPKDSAVYLINYGYAYKERRMINYGKPFIASIDKETGHKKYFKDFNLKKEPIISWNIINNNFYLATEQRILVYSIVTGEFFTEKIFSKETFGKLNYFAGNQVFVSNNDVFFRLKESDITKLYIFTDKNVLILDENLNIVETKNYDDLYIFYAEIGENKLIGNATKTFIIDKNGAKLAELSASYNAVLKGNKLFDKKGNTIEVINLEKYH